MTGSAYGCFLLGDSGSMQSVYRLKKNSAYEYIYRRGTSIPCRDMILIWCPSKQQLPKCGFSVTKKIGKATVRNRVRRRLKENARALLPHLSEHTNYVFVARANILDASYREIGDSMKYLLKKAGLYRP